MGIKKSTLRNHFEAKFSERAIQLKKHRDETIALHTDIYIKESYPDLHVITRKANELHDLVEKSMDTHKATDWEYKGEKMRDLNDVAGLREQLVKRLKTRITKFLQDESNAIESDPAVSIDFLDTLQMLKKFYTTETDKIENLKILKREVMRVINNAGSGNRAMKDLEALGLSLEGLEQTQVKENLPVIQKFSVDVCLLENTCEEETK